MRWGLETGLETCVCVCVCVCVRYNHTTALIQQHQLWPIVVFGFKPGRARPVRALDQRRGSVRRYARRVAAVDVARRERRVVRVRPRWRARGIAAVARRVPVGQEAPQRVRGHRRLARLREVVCV